MRSTSHRPARGPATGAKRDVADRSERASLYEEVTRRIIAELEAGRLPWVQPWGPIDGGGGAPGLPRNALTGRAYSGINVLILWSAGQEQGFPSQGWLTYAQAHAAGGRIRKGERGTSVVYADRFIPRQAKRAGYPAKAAQPDADDLAENVRAIPFLRRFTLFNLAQCEGLRADLAAEPVPLGRCAIVPLAEAVVEASGVAVRIGGPDAFYMPSADYVQVPQPAAFFDPVNYYRTLFHELTHATGHPSRLARDQRGAFGSKAYAREELVAEIGAAFLCASLGIVPTVRHADYIGGWLDLLRDDLSEDRAVRGHSAPGRAIFRAAAQASKAADWLLQRHRAALAARAGAPSGAAQ